MLFINFKLQQIDCIKPSLKQILIKKNFSWNIIQTNLACKTISHFAKFVARGKRPIEGFMIYSC
jgi:hypothetical protein